jgi:predicted dehydrogenase
MKTTRRAFLQSCALSAASVSLPFDFGGRTAIVGLGNAGFDHLDALLQVPPFKITAIADLRRERCDEAVKRIIAAGGDAPSCYSDGEELLRRENPDVLVIATCDRAHDGLLALAAQNRCHAVVEPMPSGSAKAWEQLCHQFARSGRQLHVVAPWRTEKALWEVVTAVRDSAESIVQARIECAEQVPLSQSSWKGSLELGGGPFSHGLFSLLDALALCNNQPIPSIAFATGTWGGRRQRDGHGNILLGGMKLQDGCDVALQYLEGTKPESVLTLSTRNQTFSWSPDRNTGLMAFWREMQVALPRADFGRGKPESFVGATALAHAWANSYLQAGTLNVAGLSSPWCSAMWHPISNLT